MLAPLAWLVLVLSPVATWTFFDVRAFLAPPIPPDRVIVLPVAVDDSYDGGLDVGLTYGNPVTGQRVATEALVFEASLRPSPGAVVEVPVDRDNPDSVALPGGREPLWSKLAQYAWMPLLPVLVTLARLWTTARTRRLIEEAAPSFSMLAAVTSATVGRGHLLHLYPLDAPASSRPMCTVALASARGLLPEGAAFPVEVKGSPRPFGRFVARRGEVVLWPSRRAGDGQDVPRPDEVDLAHGDDDANSTWARGRSDELRIALILALGLLLYVSLNTVHGARVAADAYLHAESVMAEVTAADPDGFELDVTYTSSDGTTRDAIAPVHWPEDYTVGRRYPAALLPDADLVRLRAEPYDPVEPIIWAFIPAGAAAALVIRQRI